MSELPTMEQILKDPITKKFVFLNSVEFPNQTCIGLTEETKYAGVIYKYGEVTLPDESKLDENKHLNLKFKYDILESKEFRKLLGDILYHVIIAQSGDGNIESDNRENSSKQFNIQ